LGKEEKEEDRIESRDEERDSDLDETSERIAGIINKINSLIVSSKKTKLEALSSQRFLLYLSRPESQTFYCCFTYDTTANHAAEKTDAAFHELHYYNFSGSNKGKQRAWNTK
jgi:predicted transcriptional regulator